MGGWDYEWPMGGGGVGEEHADGRAAARASSWAVDGSNRKGWGRGARSTMTLF